MTSTCLREERRGNPLTNDRWTSTSNSSRSRGWGLTPD